MGRVGVLKRFFSRQARKPSGLFGRFVAARIFDKANRVMNERMLELLSVAPGEKMLEIGFGCGDIIRTVCDQVPDVTVEGIDFSGAMLAVARKRNHRHITQGRVRLVHGDFDRTAYSPASFDAVCSANTIYFWSDPAATITRIHAVLKPGGRFVLAFVDKSRMENMGMDPDVFTPIGVDEVHSLFTQVGFTDIDAQDVDDRGVMFCMTGRA
ncbi:class I SAM-dependent methyltransferase [Pseudodesulfovibrio sp.]|uniref:class I SAM-dependent methyltransferase n=1 Tax=unclassified Pseudodesulfovibrio TaxID=2661612 RepID=UPI003AFF8319